MNPVGPNDPDGVKQAKQRFISLSGELDPLNTVRRHPLTAITAAAALGAVAASPAVEKSLIFTRMIDRVLSTSLPLINQLITGVRAATDAHRQHSKETKATDPQHSQHKDPGAT